MSSPGLRRSRWASALMKARGEVELWQQHSGYYAKNAEKFLAPEKLHPTHGEAHMESSPIRVIFCVGTMEFPILPVGPALRIRTSWPAIRWSSSTPATCRNAPLPLKVVDRRWCARWSVHQPVHFHRHRRSRHRGPAHQGRGTDEQRQGGQERCCTGGQDPQASSMELGQA